MRTPTGLIASAVALALAGNVSAAASAPPDNRTPEAIAVQVALERVCLPLLSGHTIKQVAGVSGLKSDGQGWYLGLPGAERLTVEPPGGSNPTVCTFHVTYPVDHPQPMLALLGLWAQDHHLNADSTGRPSKGPSEQRWTWSWQGAGLQARRPSSSTRKRPSTANRSKAHSIAPPCW